MNEIPPRMEEELVSEEVGFTFFPAERRTVPSDGREPHIWVKLDLMGNRFPTERHIGLLLFLFSLALYLASMSWTAFPGLPAWALLQNLDPGAPPGSIDLMWGWLVKGFARLPGLPVAGWAGLFSGLCGAAAVGLAGRLMVRVGYLIRNEPGKSTFLREAQARRLSGVVAGLYLACNIPFWVVSTRSLPGPFHLLMLLAAAWCFSQYQHWGRLKHLGGMGFLYGAGLTEFPTFLVFLPLALFLVAREMFKWRALGAWKAQLALWAGLGTGLLLYPLNAYILYRQSADIGAYIPPMQAVMQILQAQLLLVTQVRFSPGFLVIMFLSCAPWLLLFVMSRRSPWFYEWGQVSVRLIFIGGLLGVLFNAGFSPWKLLGMEYLMITPYLLMAVCMGYMAGEFWILGEPQMLLDARFTRQIVRKTASGFALLLPVVILAGGAFNWSTVDGRYARAVGAAVEEVLDRLAGRDIVFSSGTLDDLLMLDVLERKAKVLVITAQRTASPVYLRHLAGYFEEDSLKAPLQNGDFNGFLDNLLMSDKGPGRIGIIDLPDLFREFGYLAPDGFLYRIEATAGAVDLPALVALQRPFWEQMERMGTRPVPEENLARSYQNRLRMLASKIANNTGFMQLERGDGDGALETFRTALRIYPENLSVLMNLLELARERELPERADLEAQWEESLTKPEGLQWILAIRFGYVWNARGWVKRGFVWALSGVPASAEAARRNPSAEEDLGGESRAQLIDQAYLQWGVPSVDELSNRSRLVKNGRDLEALMSLCRISMRRNDPDAAEAYMAEAIAMGLPKEDTLFDRAMIDHVRGESDKALQTLEALARQTPGDARIWMALALLSEEGDPLNAEAMKTLKSRSSLGIPARLALAWIHMSRQQWADAQTELEKVIQADARNTQAWEMMAMLAQERGNQKLMDASLRALLARTPDHFVQFHNEGVTQYRKGNLEAAETAFRKGLLRKRDPILLNNLAQVIMDRDGDLKESLALVDEAMKRRSGVAGFFSTRGEIYLHMGRFEEAREDLQESLRKRGRSSHLLLLLALSYEGLGDRTRAQTAVKALALQPDKLEPKEQQQLEALRARLAEQPEPVAPKTEIELRQELDRLDEALRKTPGQGELFAARGNIHFQMGHFEEARKDLQEALKKLGRDNNLLILLARTNEGLGARARALTIAKALAGQPDKLNDQQKLEVKDLILRLR